MNKEWDLPRAEGRFIKSSGVSSGQGEAWRIPSGVVVTSRNVVMLQLMDIERM